MRESTHTWLTKPLARVAAVGVPNRCAIDRLEDTRQSMIAGGTRSPDISLPRLAPCLRCERAVANKVRVTGVVPHKRVQKVLLNRRHTMQATRNR